MDICEAKQTLEDADLVVEADSITEAINRMAKEITGKLKDQNPVAVCVMNGGLIFSGQLLTKLCFPLEVDYVHATRYGQNMSGCNIKWQARPQASIKGRTVLLLDDILDEGVTLACIAEYCRQQGAAQVFTAVLVDKRHNRKSPLLPKADFTGIETEDRFLFGYGMDYKGYWRNAPGIYAAKSM